MAVLCVPGRGKFVLVGTASFALRRATPRNLAELRELTEDAVKWLREHKDTDQWRTPWPDMAASIERMRNDLRRRKIWLAWDGATAAGTITVDTEEPVDAQRRPVWPADSRHELALYVRRVIVSRRYAGIRLGAGLLDWASDVAQRDYGARVIRVDVWTTNQELHAYYQRLRFTRCEGKNSAELGDYPSQALFERRVDQAGSDYTELFTEARGWRYHRLRLRRRGRY
jgi:ribosomal protein S18 acetylase RimI-like enzyme